ncbi:amino acid adenylation domain-containing protein [Streptomyces noursei]|uniref:amino acid adenylation domain-containing protein n=1 Tax=Streptomyces noursei TaxID=1971 RepID=UPI0023B7E24D|nr:amino acid adenylation domain-containing protein [Streptomyces noursei]
MSGTSNAFSCHLIGENTLLVSCAELLLERGHTVLGVVSPNPDVRQWATQQGLPTRDLGPDLTDFLSAHPFDHLFSIANLRMLPAEVLDLPRGLAVNFHDALLPEHAGVYATTWAILQGARRHGVTWHVMTEEADAGDVLAQREVEVAADDTSHTLNVKCFDAGVQSFAELADALARGEARRRPQDLSGRSYHGRHDRPHGAGLLSWTRPAAELSATVRAAEFGAHADNRFGTAKLDLHGRPALVSGLEVLPERSGAPAGTVLAADRDGLVVATGTQDVRLTGLTTATGAPLDAAAEDLRGRRLPDPTPELAAAATRAEAAGLRHERRWVRRLAALAPVELPGRDAAGAPAPGAAPRTYPVAVPDGAARAAADAGLRRDEWLLAGLLAFLARIGDDAGRDVDLRLPDGGTGHPFVDALRAPRVPLRVPELTPGTGMGAFAQEVARRVTDAVRAGAFGQDVWVRYPRLAGRRPAALGLPVAVELTDDPAAPAAPSAPAPGTALLVRVPRGTGRVEWVVSDGALDEATATLLAEHAGAFLRAAAGPAGADLTRTPTCSDAHRRRALIDWNDTAADYPRDRPVHALFAEQARRRPDAPAVTAGDTTLTYRQLDARATELAALLRSRGIGPGALVGVYLDRSTDLVATLLGVMKSGAAYVPLDPIYPRERLAHVLADTRLPLVVSEAALADGLPATDAEVLVLDRARSDRGAPAHPAAPARPRPDDGLAYVIYTSGSTGRPKGVRVGHRALTNFVCAMAGTPGITEDDHLLAVTTVCFDIAGLELYAPLIRGGHVELAPAETAGDGFALRALLERRRPTVMQATPATWKMLIAAGWTGSRTLRVLCGGEALPRDLARDLLARGAQLWNLYGPTETTIWSTAVRLDDAERIGIGRPIANTRCYVLDRWRQPVAPGFPGELYIGGDGVAEGYLDRPEQTAEKFVPDPLEPAAGALYRTGDLVRHRPDGTLEYLDRVDNQVKLHGYRIEPGEIEDALLGHPAVDRTAVIVREDVPGDRRLTGYVVPHRPGIDPADLRRHLGQALPAYMVPAVFVELDRLPLTANGKTDRKALPRPAQGPADGTPAAPAAGGVERTIARIWREVLNVDAVGVEDNFFETGGNSLLLMQVMARLKAEVHGPLTRVEMFKYPTVRSMARHVERQAPGPDRGPRTAVAAPVATAARPARRAPSSRAPLGELRRRRAERTPRKPSAN